MSSPTPLTPAQTEALQARFALRVTARLEDGARQLPHDITERLRVARQQAVAAAAQARLGAQAAAQAGVVSVSSVELTLAGAGSASGPAFGATLIENRHQHRAQTGRGPQDDGPTPWIWRLASALPAVALVAGLWGVGDWTRHEQVQAAADVDMSLLTDDLPPSAYADPGFEEYLKTDDSPAVTESAAMKEAEQAAAEDLAPAAFTDTETGGVPSDAAAMLPPPVPQ
ncbi:DUF3619 family protein [Aquabacterium soli]|uniref:DUF3619 family protein n=1 Tax=Aquabacterium soli TaxID=2493092 RepID=A0A426V8A8_9BURK|nr:DUF3619 family protein [Aquabacterium soli]RRS03061.1 DUF3619 family protein [Aquabacterium soli]